MSNSGGQGTSRGSAASVLDADISNSGGQGTSRGSDGSASVGADASRGASQGAGRGRGRQQTGKLWVVKDCPTAITGTVPQTIFEGPEDRSPLTSGDESSPLTPGEQIFAPLPPKVCGRVNLKPQQDEHKRYILQILDDYTFIHNGAPNTSGWFHDKFHQTNTEKFYKTWSELPDDEMKKWFNDFKMKYCCPTKSDAFFYEAFKAMICRRYKAIVNKMREKWIEKKIRPIFLQDDVWNQWLAWWDSEDFKKISERNKTNRDSNDGASCVHTGGSISCGEQLHRMKRVHGDHVDEADVFAAMHTRKGPIEGQLIWASPEHEKVFDQYIRIAREKSISDGSISPDDALDTRIPFHREAWQAAVVSFYESKGKRVKRGDRIFGFGPHGKKFLKLPSSSRSSSLICQSFSQTSNPSDDPEKEQLREEVSSLKEMMHQMMEREKERDQREQQQQEEQRQKQQQYQQWHIQQMMGGGGGPYQNQQRFNPNWNSPGFMSCIPPGGMFIPQQQQQLQLPQQQSLQQHISHSSSSNQCGAGTGIGMGTGPILDMLLDSNFNFVGAVSGNGGVGGGVCGTRGEEGSNVGSGNGVEI